jgi:TonB family protein
MPQDIKKVVASVFLGLFGTVAIISAQTTPANQTTAAQSTGPLVEKQPTSSEIMRERLSKAKAYIAVRNYNAAIYELENIRRETSDTSVNAVTNVLLMNTYLEQGDYKRAQDFLDEFFKSYKSNSAAGNFYYSLIAAQVIKGSRNQVERYRALGLSVSDRNLPLEAVNDIERMREILEVVITQAKELGADKTKSAAAMALIEEATNSRSMIARDDYDARRWRDALGDSREQIASSRSVVINAVDGTTVGAPVSQETVAANTPTRVSNPEPVFQPVAANDVPQQKQSEPIASTPDRVIEQPKQAQPQPSVEPQRTRTIENKPVVKAPVQTLAKADPAPPAAMMEVGSLIAYATKQQTPIYPPAARNLRTTGVVKVEVTVDETGEVTEVQKTSGPPLLQTAAKDAIRKWKFRPFMRDGQPVKAVGYVNFNFSL